MNSSLYSCKIYHKRTRPHSHEFNYRMFMFCIDLDEIGEVLKNPLISADSLNVFSLKASDHMQNGGKTIRENIEQYLKSCGHPLPAGRIRLLTNLRTFGYQFNPVSFYFVETVGGEPSAVVAEVANTYNEQKLYYLGPDTKNRRGVFKTQQSKNFYISPFSEPDTQFHFSVAFPEDGMQLSINQSDSEGLYFRSGITGEKRALTTLRLMAYSLRFPWITLQVIFAIHWHALLLFLKKNPVYRKRDKLDKQTRTRTYLQRNTPATQQPQI
jgi:DUF1365 family protein